MVLNVLQAAEQPLLANTLCPPSLLKVLLLGSADPRRRLPTHSAAKHLRPPGKPDMPAVHPPAGNVFGTSCLGEGRREILERFASAEIEVDHVVALTIKRPARALFLLGGGVAHALCAWHGLTKRPARALVRGGVAHAPCGWHGRTKRETLSTLAN